MVDPEYHSIKNSQIQEINFEGGKIRLLAGNYKEYKGFQGKYSPLNYYDIELNANSKIEIETDFDDSVMLFTLLSDVIVGGEKILEKTAAKLTQGNSVIIETGEKKAKVLFVGSKALNESISWGGPIVMNTDSELKQAFVELRNGTFIKN